MLVNNYVKCVQNTFINSLVTARTQNKYEDGRTNGRTDGRSDFNMPTFGAIRKDKLANN